RAADHGNPWRQHAFAREVKKGGDELSSGEVAGSPENDHGAGVRGSPQANPFTQGIGQRGRLWHENSPGLNTLRFVSKRLRIAFLTCLPRLAGLHGILDPLRESNQLLASILTQ